MGLDWQVHRSHGFLYRRWRRDERAGPVFTEARAIITALRESIDDQGTRERFQQAALGTMPKVRIPSAHQVATERYDGLTVRERVVDGREASHASLQWSLKA